MKKIYEENLRSRWGPDFMSILPQRVQVPHEQGPHTSPSAPETEEVGVKVGSLNGKEQQKHSNEEYLCRCRHGLVPIEHVRGDAQDRDICAVLATISYAGRLSPASACEEGKIWMATSCTWRMTALRHRKGQDPSSQSHTEQQVRPTMLVILPCTIASTTCW
jgi:hypothetical protein